ncbi:hypothetical protein [Rhodoferax aquaticus]|uniref:Uncharacterized protein n=1 Tax=Rhodoferax aquaticus TaxID=2527691 RepID=A0A515ERS4_9BURK|nr:hypothetical protein [Rhodoferax aquaticus]QDL55354.1 hypothetical protein EXZ61_14890 [Rhodoferax aquaticus]
MKSLKCMAQAAGTFTARAKGQALGLAATAPLADAALQAQIEARYQGDLSGACAMAAVSL